MRRAERRGRGPATSAALGGESAGSRLFPPGGRVVPNRTPSCRDGGRWAPRGPHGDAGGRRRALRRPRGAHAAAEPVRRPRVETWHLRFFFFFSLLLPLPFNGKVRLCHFQLRLNGFCTQLARKRPFHKIFGEPLSTQRYFFSVERNVNFAFFLI